MNIIVCKLSLVLLLLSKNVVDGLKRFRNYTTCEDFERGAVFDPRKIVDSSWRIFYFWGKTVEMNPIKFRLADTETVNQFKKLADKIDPYLEIDYPDARFLMYPRPGITVMYLDAITPGAYRAIVIAKSLNKVKSKPVHSMSLYDIRLKFIGWYVGMLLCEDLTAYIMVRNGELPQNDTACEMAALAMNYKGHPGYCYLHISEADIVKKTKK